MLGTNLLTKFKCLFIIKILPNFYSSWVNTRPSVSGAVLLTAFFIIYLIKYHIVLQKKIAHTGDLSWGEEEKNQYQEWQRNTRENQEKKEEKRSKKTKKLKKNNKKKIH